VLVQQTIVQTELEKVRLALRAHAEASASGDTHVAKVTKMWMRQFVAENF
jgi:hypothetical protein